MAATGRFEVTPPPTGRPLMIWDGDCAFCRLWIHRWRSMTGDRVDYATSQEAGPRFPGIPAEAFDRTVVFVGTDGVALTGAEAVLAALARARRGGWGLALYRHMPGFAPLTEAAYAFISSHRRLFSRLTRWLWGASALPPSYGLSRCLFLRALGLIYLIAFVSLWSQVDGLIGSRGILPIEPWLRAVADRHGPERFWQIPTLCWLDGSDRFLHLQCAAGVVAALLALAGLLPAVALAAAWGLYLSLTVAGRDFLGFQWDNLLLESGLLAVLMAPLTARCRIGCDASPPRLPLALGGWLLFRLMLSSGIVKLSSGDDTWWDLTALTYHYQTQCLPPWTAWYAHHLPLWFQKLSCFVMFAIELGAPWLILTPRRTRHLGAGALVALQILILLSGNYGFFNLLTIALCLLMLDDTFWPLRFRPGMAAAGVEARTTPRPRRWPGWVILPIAVILFVVGAVRLDEAFRMRLTWPAPVASLARGIAPLRSVNWYGLFSSMTTTRPEIVVEGSRDGVTWEAYEFRWKPGDLSRRPRFTTPHMPRLDWQMWFAALGDYRGEPWFTQLLARLLEGSPPVIDLLARDPFGGSPPRYIRAVLYQYEFTDAEERRTTGRWWRRERLRDYTPVFTGQP